MEVRSTAFAPDRSARSERTSINQATLYRIETARGRPQPRTLLTLLDLYGVAPDEREELQSLLRESAQRGWLRTYDSELPEMLTTFMSFESEASQVWDYETLCIPGLLQTESYARALIRGGLPTAGRGEVEARVEARSERQSLLTADDPLRLWAVIDEAAVRRRAGSDKVMDEQRTRLIEAADLPNVTVQVIPFDAGAHPGMPGAFIMLKFEGPNAPDVVHIDSMAGDLFLEEAADVRRYTLIFEHLRAIALSPDASVALIEALTGGD